LNQKTPFTGPVTASRSVAVSGKITGNRRFTGGKVNHAMEGVEMNEILLEAQAIFFSGIPRGST